MFKIQNHLCLDLEMVWLASIDSCKHIHSTITIAVSDKECAILISLLLQHIYCFIPIQSTMIPIFLLSFWHRTLVVFCEIQ